MVDGFTLEVNLDFGKAKKQMAEFEKKHGSLNVSLGGTRTPGNSGNGIGIGGEMSAEFRKMAQAIRVSTGLFNQLNASMSSFKASISLNAKVARGTAVAATSGANVAGVPMGKAGAVAMQVPGWAMLTNMASAPLRQVWASGTNYINAYRTQARNELGLMGVLQNAGMDANAFATLKAQAGALQGRTIYGDEALLAGAGELATYIKDKNGKVSLDNMQRMMSILTNYASGMTNNSAVDSNQMIQLATGLGMAFDGNYRALRMKGFDTSELEALKAAENKGASVSPEQKVAALEKALADWAGRAEEFAKTEEGREIQTRNRLGDIEEAVGNKITPAYERLTKTVSDNLPSLERFKFAIGDLFVLFVDKFNSRIPDIAKGLDHVSGLMTNFAENTTLVGESMRTAGGAMAIIVGLKFGTQMQKMAAEMAEAVNHTENLRDGINKLGKTSIGQAGLFLATSWALGKIGEAGSLVIDLVKSKWNEYKGNEKNELWNNAYDRFSKAREDYKSGKDGSWSSYYNAVDQLVLMNKRLGYDELKGLNENDLKRLGWEWRRKSKPGSVTSSKPGSATSSIDGGDPKTYNFRHLAKEAKRNLTVNNNNTNIRQENHIEAGFDEIGKLIKENLQEILISHLTFRGEFESMKGGTL